MDCGDQCRALDANNLTQSLTFINILRNVINSSVNELNIIIICEKGGPTMYITVRSAGINVILVTFDLSMTLFHA